jgi:hypothetical protein
MSKRQKAEEAAADSYHLTGSREERATVSKRQQVEKGATRFSPSNRIQGRRSHYGQETTNGKGSNQILTF